MFFPNPKIPINEIRNSYEIKLKKEREKIILKFNINILEKHFKHKFKILFNSGGKEVVEIYIFE